VGKAYVTEQGLYYRIRCRCAITSDVIHRLVVSCGDRQESLGILVPFGQEFGLDTKIAAKRIGRGELRFTVRPKRNEMKELLPLSPEEPFAYIRRLKECYLVRMNGQCYAALKE
jgi:hypothetical protein